MQISFRADIVSLIGYFYPQLWPAQVLQRVTLVPAWHLAGVILCETDRALSVQRFCAQSPQF